MQNKKKIFIASVSLNVIVAVYLLVLLGIAIKEKVDYRIRTSNGQITYFMDRDQLFRLLPNDTSEIVFIGDSHIQGFELAEFFKDLRLKNRGINSDKITGMLPRLDEAIESKPLKLFIEAGANDITHGSSANNVIGNYRQLINYVKQHSPQTKIYATSLLPTPNNVYRTTTPQLPIIQETNRQLQALCKEESITYIDLYTPLMKGNQANPHYFWIDSIHLNGKGYLLWKNLIEKYVKE